MKKELGSLEFDNAAKVSKDDQRKCARQEEVEFSEVMASSKQSHASWVTGSIRRRARESNQR